MAVLGLRIRRARALLVRLPPRTPGTAAGLARLSGGREAAPRRTAGSRGRQGGPLSAPCARDEAEVRMAARSMFARQSLQGATATGVWLSRSAPGRTGQGTSDPGNPRSARYRADHRLAEGGTTAEIVRDFAVDLPPLNLALARALVARPRVAAMLAGFRDMPWRKRGGHRGDAGAGQPADRRLPGDRRSVHLPAVRRTRKGCRPGGRVDSAARTWRAGGWSPWPVDVQPVEHWTARGEKLTIRPIRPEDAEQHAHCSAVCRRRTCASGFSPPSARSRPSRPRA